MIPPPMDTERYAASIDPGHTKAVIAAVSPSVPGMSICTRSNEWLFPPMTKLGLGARAEEPSHDAGRVLAQGA
jgi:hypothetical protein